jgi:hypothetical protein
MGIADLRYKFSDCRGFGYAGIDIIRLGVDRMYYSP